MPALKLIWLQPTAALVGHVANRRRILFLPIVGVKVLVCPTITPGWEGGKKNVGLDELFVQGWYIEKLIQWISRWCEGGAGQNADPGD